MKVFVWRDHGGVEVYAAESHKQRILLADQIYARCVGYGLDEAQLQEALKSMRPVEFFWFALELAGDDQELFQHGTGFHEVIDLEDS